MIVFLPRATRGKGVPMYRPSSSPRLPRALAHPTIVSRQDSVTSVTPFRLERL